MTRQEWRQRSYAVRSVNIIDTMRQQCCVCVRCRLLVWSEMNAVFPQSNRDASVHKDENTMQIIHICACSFGRSIIHRTDSIRYACVHLVSEPCFIKIASRSNTCQHTETHLAFTALAKVLGSSTGHEDPTPADDSLVLPSWGILSYFADRCRLVCCARAEALQGASEAGENGDAAPAGDPS